MRSSLRFPNATESGEHYVLPVAVNHRHKLQGVVHRTSSPGETVYIEPAGVAHLSAERAVVKAEEDKEIRRILRGLSAEVGRVARPLCFAIDLMAHLDLVTAKARFSQDFALSPPVLNSEGRLWLRQARHPLLEHLFRNEVSPGLRPGSDEAKANEVGPSQSAVDLGQRPGLIRQVVPIDVHLGVSYNLLIITGPNTGGKTVALKTTGLLCLMAQSGMHIPAGEGSPVPMVRQILATTGRSS